MSTAFISSFTIIFRESLEAVLIVAAIYGYLNQIGETSAKKITSHFDKIEQVELDQLTQIDD